MTEENIGIEVVDTRDALGVVILRETAGGQVDVEMKGLQISKADAANLFYALAVRLKRQALEEGEAP